MQVALYLVLWVAGWFLLQFSKLSGFSLGSSRAEIHNRRNVVTKRDDGNTAGCRAIPMHIWTGREIHFMPCQLTFASQLAFFLLLTSCLVCDRIGLQDKRVQYKQSERGNIPNCFSRVRHMLDSKLIPVSSLYTGTITVVHLICVVIIWLVVEVMFSWHRLYK